MESMLSQQHNKLKNKQKCSNVLDKLPKHDSLSKQTHQGDSNEEEALLKRPLSSQNLD